MIAIDTNVLIYASDKSEPARQKKALETIAKATDAVLLWQVACEFVAACRKLADQGSTRADAWARLAECLALFPLTMPGPSVLDRARALHRDRQWSFWGAMIVAACREGGVTRVYSEDLPGQTIDGLEIVNPFR
jgi:predicted nucleic acid-binding protein